MIEDKPLEKRRVLVIEDEYFVAESLRCIIESAGGTVLGPYSGLSDELYCLSSSDVDVVSLDLNLKGVLALDFANVLHERGIPFCLVTGYDIELVPKIFNVSNVIIKPFIRSELIQALSVLCE